MRHLDAKNHENLAPGDYAILVGRHLVVRTPNGVFAAYMNAAEMGLVEHDDGTVSFPNLKVTGYRKPHGKPGDRMHSWRGALVHGEFVMYQPTPAPKGQR